MGHQRAAQLESEKSDGNIDRQDIIVTCQCHCKTRELYAGITSMKARFSYRIPFQQPHGAQHQKPSRKLLSKSIFTLLTESHTPQKHPAAELSLQLHKAEAV